MSKPLPGRTIRTKLLLLTGVPSILGLILLGLFAWAHYASADAFRTAALWQQHAHVIDRLDWATSTYVEEVGDPFESGTPTIAGRQDVDGVATARAEVASARTESAALAMLFSTEEQADEAELSALVNELVTRGERVGLDVQRYTSLEAFYDRSVRPAIAARRASEHAGQAASMAHARDLTRRIHGAGFAFGGIMLLGALGVSIAAARRFAAGVGRLELQAERIAAGDLDQQVCVDSDDELGRLAMSLEAMTAELRRQRQSQLGFLAGVAHDLRNPLAAMRTSAEGLLRREQLPEEPSVRRTLGLVNRQIDRLARLADDLLDAARSEAGQLDMNMELCDLRDTISEVGELYRHASARHVIVVTVPNETVRVECDRMRIAQVIDNLMSNAIKYSPAGGRIDLALAKIDGRALMTVTDEGVGIEDSAKSLIFEPFRRIAPSRDVIPGVGLGLALARRIVTAHGGTIEVESTPGRGSTFRVELPLAEAKAEPQPSMRRAG